LNFTILFFFIEQVGWRLMLHLILVETALELIPNSLLTEPSIRNAIKKYGNAGYLFDTSLHHSVLSKLKSSNKRGRPDILHHFLLDTLGSPANLSDHLKIYFHTNKALYEVSSDMRCPRDYLRFKALMTQLLKLGHIPKEKPFLIKDVSHNFYDWIKDNFSPDQIIKFSSKGEQIAIKDIFANLTNRDENIAFLVGGFQKGDFSPRIQELSGKSYAISDRGYDSWIIINRLLAVYEQFLDLY